MSEQQPANSDSLGRERLPLMTRRRWLIVRRWSRALGLLFLALMFATAAGSLIWKMYVPTYRAEAWLQISNPEWVFRMPADSQRFVSNQLELIASPLVLGPVVADPAIAALPEIKNSQAPIPWLRHRITVNAKGQSEYITVSFTGSEPESAAKTVNAIVDSYFELRDQEDARRIGLVIGALKKEQENRSERLQRLRDTYRQLSIQQTGKDPWPSVQLRVSPDGNMVPVPLENSAGWGTPFGSLQDQLVNTKVKRAILDAQIQVQRDVRAREPTVSPAEVERAVEQHPKVLGLKRDLADKRSRLREYETVTTKGERDPNYQSLESEIEEDERRLAQLRQELVPEVRDEMKLALDNERKGKLAAMESQLDSYRLMEQILRQRYDSELQNVKEYAGETLELERARYDFALAQGVFEQIVMKIDELETRQRAPARVVLKQSAVPPRMPESTPFKRMVLAILAGFCLPLLVAALYGPVRRAFGPREVEDPVLGHLRRDASGLWRGEAVFDEAGQIGVAVRADKKGPRDVHRHAFLELKRRYGDLKPAIADALLTVYNDYRAEAGDSDAEERLPELSGPDEIWPRVRLLGLRMETSPDAESPHFVLGYTLDWDESHLARVFVWDWQVVRTALAGR